MANGKEKVFVSYTGRDRAWAEWRLDLTLAGHAFSSSPAKSSVEK